MTLILDSSRWTVWTVGRSHIPYRNGVTFWKVNMSVDFHDRLLRTKYATAVVTRHICKPECRKRRGVHSV